MSTNGRLDVADLATIPGGTKMGGSALIRADLLPGLVGLQAAFLARFDAPLRPTSAADGYRSYNSQVRAFLGRYAPQATGVGPFSDVRWWQGRRYVRVSGASAAVPGTSNHGWAIAVDFADVGATGGTRWSWLMDAAPRFGFVNPLWARDGIPSNGSQEPWHWEGRAVPVSNYRTFLAGMGVAVPNLTSPTPIEEDDMPTPEEIADAVWRHSLAESGGIGPAPAQDWLKHTAIHATEAGKRARAAEATASRIEAAIKSLPGGGSLDPAALAEAVRSVLRSV